MGQHLGLGLDLGPDLDLSHLELDLDQGFNLAPGMMCLPV